MATKTKIKTELAHKAPPRETRAKQQILPTENTEIVLGESAAFLSEIRSLHGDVLQAARLSFEKGVRIGELLTEIKKRCGHGNWLQYLEENLPFPERTAQQYMRLFAKQDALKSANFADLSISQAYLHLAKPTPPSKDQAPSREVPHDADVNASGSDEETAEADEPFGQCSEPGKTQPLQQPDGGVTPELEHSGASVAEIEPAMNEAGAPMGDAVDQVTRGGESVEPAGPPEEPLFLLTDGTPILESQWIRGVVTLEDVGNDFRARVERNTNAPERLRYSREDLLLNEHLTLRLGQVLNELVPTPPSTKEANCVEEALTFLRNRVKIATPPPPRPQTSAETEL